MQICRQLPIRKIALSILTCSVLLFVLIGCKKNPDAGGARTDTLSEDWRPISVDEMPDLAGIYLTECGSQYLVIGEGLERRLEVQRFIDIGRNKRWDIL